MVTPVVGQQPNFIFFYPDQLRSQEMGCYGNTVADTQNMDTLAAAGLRFEVAVPGLPVCTPARACVLTGRMPFSVRSSSAGYDWMIVNKIDMHTDEVSIAEELNPLGYTCGHIGSKWHVADVGGLDCITERQGFTVFEALNSYGKYDVAQYRDTDCIMQTGTGWQPDFMTSRAINFITANQNNPFYLNVWLSPPHAPRNLHWGELHFDDPNNPDRLISWTFDGRLDLWNNSPLPSIASLRPNIIPSLQDEAQRQIREYNALTTGIDQCLGQIITTLQTLGIDNKTIIIVSADHGSQLGSHATAFETTVGWEKNEIYDESILVPLIVYDPRNPPSVHVRSEPIHQMDILPTVLELAGGPAPQRAQGRSFAPLVTGQGTYQPRDAVLVQYNSSNFLGTGYSNVRALRTSQWKYAVAEISGNPQGIALFDLVNDPYEQTNLISNPAYDATKTLLHNRIITEMQDLDDPLVVTPLPLIELSTQLIELSVAKSLDANNDNFDVTNDYVGTLNYTITDSEGWLSCTPTNGTLAYAESDTITIQYSTASLAEGDYLATITVSGNASNSPQELSVNLNVFIPGDLDGDDDVDQEDFGKFQRCYTGMGEPPTTGCEYADFNNDNDVDLSDFNLLHNCMAGANNPPGC
jgi:arylsulfatase A-like enzyme